MFHLFCNFMVVNSPSFSTSVRLYFVIVAISVYLLIIVLVTAQSRSNINFVYVQGQNRVCHNVSKLRTKDFLGILTYTFGCLHSLTVAFIRMISSNFVTLCNISA